MSHNFENLKAHILPLSEANQFEIARLEWELESVAITEDFDQCPCGQAIKEHCYIRNRSNQNATYVGNVCINRFMEIQTGNLFEGLKRISTDLSANANKDVIEYAFRRGYLYGPNEYTFLKSTALKRNLSAAQIAWKQKINRRIIQQVVVRRRGDAT